MSLKALANATKEQDNTSLWQFLDLVVGAGLVVAIGITGYNTKELIALSNRVTALENSRFSAEDGLKVWREISLVRENIARLPTEGPPKWFVDKVANLESVLQSSSKTIQRLESLAEIRAASIENLTKSIQKLEEKLK